MTTRARRGYTLFELIVVMTILLLLAAVVLPSVAGFRGDTRQRATADVIRGELAIARARAMEEGRPYRVAFSEDGARIRRAPDDTNFELATAFDQPSGSVTAVDYPFDLVTAQVVADQDVQAAVAANGWVTVAQVQPDGTCRKDSVLILLKEEDQAGLYIRVRGVTGTSRVVPNPNASGTGGPR